MILDARARRFVLTFLVLVAVTCVGCDDDDDDDPTDPNGNDIITVTLHHDGDNLTAPSLAGDTWEAAARFTTADTAGLGEGELTRVRFYISSLPTSCHVRVYADGAGDEPGPLVYSANVTSSLTANDWNTHTLTDPVAIPDGDLWLAIQFTHAGLQPTIGCDAGPADDDGRWLWDSTSTVWQPFSADVNWNIRGVVEVPD